MRHRHHRWFRPVVPCTLLGAALGTWLQVYHNNLIVAGPAAAGAVAGLFIGLLLEELPRPRFSLAALLLMTTIVAGVLGLAVARDWVTTKPQNTIPQSLPFNGHEVPGFTPL